MAKASTRRSRAPTAASRRAPRGRAVPSSSPVTNMIAPEKSLKAMKPPKKGQEIAAKKTGAVFGGKRGKRKAATKARSVKDAVKERKTKKTRGGDKEDSEPIDAPEPVKMYNDELKTSALEWEVESIIDSKMKKTRQYLVKWVGYPHSANTWEPEAIIFGTL